VPETCHPVHRGKKNIKEKGTGPAKKRRAEVNEFVKRTPNDVGDGMGKKIHRKMIETGIERDDNEEVRKNPSPKEGGKNGGWLGPQPFGKGVNKRRSPGVHRASSPATKGTSLKRGEKTDRRVGLNQELATR